MKILLFLLQNVFPGHIYDGFENLEEIRIRMNTLEINRKTKQKNKKQIEVVSGFLAVDGIPSLEYVDFQVTASQFHHINLNLGGKIMDDNGSSIWQQTNQGIIEQIPFGIGTVHHNLADLTPTASEIGFLWTSYEAETMAICFLKKWANESTDPEMHILLQSALDMTTERVEKIENIFTTVNYPIPIAFGEKDVNINSPSLFNQNFTCSYVRMMQTFISIHYAAAASASYRTDFRNYFSECIKTSDDIHRKTTEILLAKGILQKNPSIAAPHSIETVESKDYFGSYFKILGEERTLNAMEISHIYKLMEIKQLIRTLNLGYSQVVKSEKIKKFLLKSIKVADNHLSYFTSIFKDENIPVPSLSDITITDATETGLSDKLILLHSTGAAAYILTAYGISTPTLMRKDLILNLAKFTTDLLRLAKNGAELTVEAGWLERMPQTLDRQELSH